MKSFFGLDLKTGGKVVLWTHIIENTAMYIFSLVLMASSRHGSEGLSRYQSALMYQEEIENIFQSVSPTVMTNFGAIFSMLGASIAILVLALENSKVWRFLWLVHQGISVELLTIVILRLLYAQRFTIDFVICAILPALIFLLLKTYSWFMMISLWKLLKKEAKEKVGITWITNSLLVCRGTGLSLPMPDVIGSHQRF